MPTIVESIRKEFKDDIIKARKELSKAKKEISMARKEKEEIAKKLINKGMDFNSIEEITGIPLDRLKKMIN